MVFPTFLNLSPNLAISISWSEPQSASGLVLCSLGRIRSFIFMALRTICSDFVAPQNKVCHHFHCFRICLPWSDGTGCHDFSKYPNNSFFLVCLVTIASYSFSFQEINLLFSLFSLSNIIFTIFVSCSIFCIFIFILTSVQIRSVAQSCPTFWDAMKNSTWGLPDHHQLLEFTQTHVHQVSDAI